MAVFNTVKIGDILYHVPGTGRRGHYFPVKILDLDLVERKALISHNNNKPYWVSEARVKGYRRTPPKDRTS